MNQCFHNWFYDVACLLVQATFDKRINLERGWPVARCVTPLLRWHEVSWWPWRWTELWAGANELLASAAHELSAWECPLELLAGLPKTQTTKNSAEAKRRGQRQKVKKAYQRKKSLESQSIEKYRRNTEKSSEEKKRRKETWHNPFYSHFMSITVANGYEYEKKNLIGHGAFAIVFKGKHRQVLLLIM